MIDYQIQQFITVVIVACIAVIISLIYKIFLIKNKWKKKSFSKE